MLITLLAKHINDLQIIKFIYIEVVPRDKNARVDGYGNGG
jgi:hypothetical protein